MAYLSNEVDVATTQVYVQPFDSNKPSAPVGPAVQLTNLKGGVNWLTWRQDGKEVFFVTRDGQVMAVDFSSDSKLQSGTPRLLFKVADPLAGVADVSPDGQRFVAAMPAK